MSYITDLGLTDWELEQAKLDELYSYDKDEPWWQRLVRVINYQNLKQMKRFVKFSVHEYMDMYPRTEMRIYEGDSLESITTKAKEWAENMTKAYSGGPTTFESVLTSQEAFDWFKKEVQSMKYPCKSDLEWIQKTADAITECYPEISE